MDRAERILSIASRRAVLKAACAGAILAASRRARAAIPPLHAGVGFQGSGGSQFPLLQSSNLTYLGVFNIPNTVNGTDTTYASLRGFTHDTKSGVAPDGVLYMDCASNGFTSFGIAVPTRSQISNWSTTLTTATAAYNPVTFSNYAGTGGASYGNSGVIDYGGKIIYQQSDVYGNYGQMNTAGVSSYDMLTVSPMIPATGTLYSGGGTGSGHTGLRHINQFVGTIPSAWQSAFGGGYLIGAGVQSTYQDCCMGVSAYVWNPQDVINGTNPFPVTCAMDFPGKTDSQYTSNTPLGAKTAACGWESWDLNVNATSGSTTLTVNSVMNSTTGRLIVTGPVGTGAGIASGSESTQTATGLPVGATLLSQLSGTTGGAGTYQMSSAATGNVSSGWCALGSADNGYARPDCTTYGFMFPSGYRTVAYVQAHGTGFLTYKNPNDSGAQNSGAGSGFGSMPYTRRLLMFDANDLINVIKGVINPYDPVPYATWDISVAGSLLPSGGEVKGIAYDDAPLNGNPKRVYICTTSQNPSTDFAAYVHVFEVN